MAGDTRRLSHVSGGLLAAVLVGVATVTTTLAGRDKAMDIGPVALLAPVIVSWAVSAVFLLLSEGPVTRALAELRRATGAPVQFAPWRPLGLQPLSDQEVTWDYVVPLIAAATRRHTRARIALSAAVITTVVFLLWTALALAAVAKT